MKFSITYFFSKCDQIRRKLRIWSHLLKKSVIENFIFCAVYKLATFRTAIFRNSRPEVFCKIGALRNFAKLTGKHLCQRLFFNKVAGLGSTTLLKKILWHRCFPANFAKFLRTPFFLRTPAVAASIFLRTIFFQNASVVASELNNQGQ